MVLWCFPEPLLPDLLDLTDKDSSEWNLSGDEVEGTRETLTCGESFVWLLNSLKWCAYFDWLLFLCVSGSLSESGEEPEEAETRVMRSHRTSRGRTKDSSWPESIPEERKKLKLEWKEIGEEEEKDKGKKSETDLCLKGQEVATKKGILKESLLKARGEKKRKSGAKRVRFNLKRTDEPSSDSDDMYVQDWVTGMKNPPPTCSMVSLTCPHPLCLSLSFPPILPHFSLLPSLPPSHFPPLPPLSLPLSTSPSHFPPLPPPSFPPPHPSSIHPPTHLVVWDLQQIQHDCVSAHVPQQPLLMCTVVSLAEVRQLNQNLKRGTISTRMKRKVLENKRR